VALTSARTTARCTKSTVVVEVDAPIPSTPVDAGSADACGIGGRRVDGCVTRVDKSFDAAAAAVVPQVIDQATQGKFCAGWCSASSPRCTTESTRQVEREVALASAVLEGGPYGLRRALELAEQIIEPEKTTGGTAMTRDQR